MHPSGSRQRDGFTLFEIAISMLVLAVVVLATLALIPAVARTQQQARYQFYAAALANQLTSQFYMRQENQRRVVEHINLNSAHHSGLQGYGPLFQASARMGVEAHFDFENAVAGIRSGQYPVPVELARRLDSPGDLIQKTLDAGAHLYYPEPAPIPGFTPERNVTGGDLGAVPELQKIVWAVIDPPQQNILPSHLSQEPQQEPWPFPPRGITGAGPWVHTSVGGVRYELTYTGSVTPPPSPPDPKDWEWRLIVSTTERGSRDSSHYGARAAHQRLHIGNVWEWYAYMDELAGRTVSGSDSPWWRGLPEFRRLMREHWARIAAHYESLSSGAATLTYTLPYVGPVTWTDSNGNGERELGEERDVNGFVIPLTPGVGSGSIRGFPAPAIGLPEDADRRSTDILHEDHEVAQKDLHDQIRRGMASLERRVMYRTAALALWTRVSDDVAISARPAWDSGLVPSGVIGDPNRIDQVSAGPLGAGTRPGLSGAVYNPLLEEVPLPADPRTIHPAQIMALNFLAHSAMLVTGYQPPFNDDGDSIWPVGGRRTDGKVAVNDRSLITDETLPWRDLTPDLYYLWKPFGPVPKVVATSSGVPTRYTHEQPIDPPLAWSAMGATVATFAPTSMVSVITSTGAIVPFTYRRMTGPVLNAFPPPYADRGAFNWRGQAFNRPVPVLTASGSYRVLWASANYAHPPGFAAFTPIDPSDTQMARVAMHNLIRWGRAYLAENPHDMTIPKPTNLQLMQSKPMYSLDLFDPAGLARRGRTPDYASATGARWSKRMFYPITWSSDRARFALSQWQGGNQYPGYRDGVTMVYDNRDQAVNLFSLASGGALPANVQYYLPYTTKDQTTAMESVEFLPPTGSVTNEAAVVQFTPPNDALPGVLRIDQMRRYFGWALHARLRLNDVHGFVETSQMPTGVTYNVRTSGPGGLRIDHGADPRAVQNGSAVRPERFWQSRPFAPQSRMRTLVFWAVDWKSYVDAETAPSAPTNLSRLAGRNLSVNLAQPDSWNWANSGLGTGGAADAVESFMSWANPARDKTLSRFLGNGNVFDSGAASWEDTRFNIHYSNSTGMGGIDDNPWTVLGAWGADRNFNGTCDVGPVPKTVRMQALEIGRFVFYDPIGPTSVGY